MYSGRQRFGDHDLRGGDGKAQGFTVAANKWDSGTVTLTVGSSQPVSVSYGPGSTPESIAESLAGSYSGFNVTAVNNTLYIEATAAGTDPTYSLNATSSDGFSPASFLGGSGTLDGGSSGSSSSSPVYCFGPPGSSFSSTGCTPSNNSMYDPVGNVVGYTDYTGPLNGNASSAMNRSWTYNYTLNRLAGGTGSITTNGTTTTSNNCWSYDSFGNRTMQSLTSSSCPDSSQSTFVYNANNQVSGVIPPGGGSQSPSPYSYDSAGDVTTDLTTVNQYLYDAEGRICAVQSPSVAGGWIMTGYVYDAEGNRVAKGTITSWSCNPSVNGLTTAGNETDYVLGPGGEQVTELAQDANGSMNWQRTYVYAGGALIATYGPVPNPTYPTSGPQTLYQPSFRFTDWLGTMRATTDSTGVLQGTCTGLPFGDGMDCSNSPDPHYFTGKERDTESGNDYFGARYYASSMGRWLSPDWSAKVMPVPYAKLDNPQSLNLYAYVGSNPLVRTDPTGHYNSSCTAKTVSGCSADIQKFDANLQKDLHSKSASVRASAAAYGSFNDGNKVNLKIDPNATHGTTRQDVTNGKRQDTVTVTLPTNEDKGLVAHEGSHVEDFNGVMSGGAPVTQYQSEMKAFKTQAGTLLDDYPSGTVGPPATMTLSLGNATMVLMQPFDSTAQSVNQSAINTFLGSSQAYGLSEENQGGDSICQTIGCWE